jgi:hypothetical protein
MWRLHEKDDWQCRMDVFSGWRRWRGSDELRKVVGERSRKARRGHTYRFAFEGWQAMAASR